MVEIYWQIQNFMVGHIVPLKVDSHRNNWPMAKIIRVCPDKSGAARNVQLLVGSCNGTKAVLDRPTDKFFLLVEAEEGPTPQRRTRANQDDMIT